MKDSEAIRKGCEMTPGQCYTQLFVFNGQKHPVATCALGALYEGRHGRIEWDPLFVPGRSSYVAVAKVVSDDVAKVVSDDLREGRSRKCPVVDCPDWGAIYNEGSLNTLIPHLNDHHRWTREQIADWLESIGR